MIKKRKPTKLIRSSEIVRVNPEQKARTTAMDTCSAVVIQGKGKDGKPVTYTWHSAATHVNAFNRPRQRIIRIRPDKVSLWRNDAERRRDSRRALKSVIEGGSTHDMGSTESMHPNAIISTLLKSMKGLSGEVNVTLIPGRNTFGNESQMQKDAGKSFRSIESVLRRHEKAGTIKLDVRKTGKDGRPIGVGQVEIDEGGKLSLDQVREW